MTIPKYQAEVKLPYPLKDPSCIDLINTDKAAGKGEPIQGRKFLYVGSTEIIDTIINPELSEIFKSKNLTPMWVLVFGHARRDLYPNFPDIVHSDVFEVDGKWVKIPFSINWELSETDAEFKWWDVAGAKEWYSDVKTVRPNEPRTRIRGCWYGNVEPITVNFAHNFERLHTYTLKRHCTTLVNPTVPHSVTYPPGAEYRAGLSYRFPLEQISTWEQGYELFKEFCI